ncbi:SGNH/GDSL hydrolase family protein [Rhizorhapis suberifaciens]|uniref:Lysophospholipase L1-like esterase n=1 Tax=Rhizorhapis suberifaciens TaxID=13656 RepID=A0A840HQL2_9SPHN|nr:SGNH/GDSL hydrolase family protein [Rhizorhapis suberifaciens]MBB4639856.1 lysophospholipase L1-like esterase [Rhizorhapis suberifaciens]
MLKILMAAFLSLLPISVQAQGWSRSWSAVPHRIVAPLPDPAVPDIRDSTIRQVVRLSDGGDLIRIRLSNELSEKAVLVGAVHVALVDKAGQILPDTGRIVTFGRKAAFHLPAQAPLVSDAVRLPVKALSRIAISMYLPEGAVGGTLHWNSYATGWIGPGNQVGAPMLERAGRFDRRLILSAVEVQNRQPHRTIVALGDSITDGANTSPDLNRRWPDILAERLLPETKGAVGVANAGISGNRVLRNGSGPNALARFDRDVLAVPGVSHAIILEGVNDIGAAWRAKDPVPPSAEDLISAYRQLIERAHEHGVKAVLGTILPFKGAGYWSDYGENVRRAVNSWIRDNKEADGHVDFDRALADPADPSRLAPQFNSGDFLHPNDAGHAAMAHAIDLNLLLR